MSAAGMDAPTAEAAQEIKRLALQLAAVVDALERRSADAVGAIDDGRMAIHNAANQLGQRGEQLVATVAREAQAQTRAAAESALTPIVDTLRAQLEAAAAKAQHSADALHKERAALVTAQGRAFWIASVTLGVGALMTATASAWWVMQQRDELARVEFAQQIHAATSRGALVPYGKSLCARVGERPRRTGTRDEFLVVE